jgi:hypothetical protein
MMQDQGEGFSVDARFSSYYLENGGEEIFGVAISQAFEEDEIGTLVQYFENARLELVNVPDGGMQVKTSSLSMMLGYWEAPLEFIDEKDGCRFYHETGHQVCHAFLEYYEDHGGPEVFGYPISEFRFEDDRVVQYYQRFRLDWFEAEEGQPVRPGPLGKLHIARIDQSAYGADVTPVKEAAGLIILSSVERSSTKMSDNQTLYLLVQNQDRQALQGAAATLIAHFPDEDRMMVLPLTDNNGRSQITFEFENQPPGFQVSLEITVVYEGLTRNARESFMIYLHETNP